MQGREREKSRGGLWSSTTRRLSAKADRRTCRPVALNELPESCTLASA